MIFALLKNNICVNTIEAEQSFIDEWKPLERGYDAIVNCTELGLSKYGAGQIWNGEKFMDVEEYASSQG